MLKVINGFSQKKKYQSDNQQECIDHLKPKSNKNKRVCK